MELLNKTINPGAAEALEFNYAGVVTGKLTSFKITKNEGVLLSITSDRSEAVSFETGKIFIHLNASETMLLQSLNTENDLSYSLILMLRDEPNTREVLYTGSILTGAAAPEQAIKYSEVKREAEGIITLNGEGIPAINIFINNTAINFTIERDDAGMYKIFADKNCFSVNSYTAFTQVRNELDLLGFTIGIMRGGDDTEIYLSLLHPTEGYKDVFAELFIRLSFSE